MEALGSRQARTKPVSAGNRFVYPEYPFVRPPELTSGSRRRYPVVVVGGGMVGLTAALDLGTKGIDCILLDDNNTVSAGSRSIGQARKSVEIWERLGCAAPMLAKGRSWNHGKQLYGDKEIYHFELGRDEDYLASPMMVLPQYFVESFIVDRIADFPNVDIRWLNRVTGVTNAADGVVLSVETPEGSYEVEADWVIAADGVKSTMRDAMGLEFSGQKVSDRFVIADIKSNLDLPPERLFWFNPSFHEGNSVLCLRQQDGVSRVDWNIGPTADPDKERSRETIASRLEAMFGTGVEFDLEWASIYSVEMRRLARFRHGRVFFAGDAAHQLSPFGGGRGGNSGVQDVDNLVWKLAAVIAGQADEALLDTYDGERGPVTDENLTYSRQATEFITPTNAVSAAFQQAVLTLSRTEPDIRPYINSGRFYRASPLVHSPLFTPDTCAFSAPDAAPGCAALDAPIETAQGKGWLISQLRGAFTLLIHEPTGEDLRAIETLRSTKPELDVLISRDTVSGDGASMSDIDGVLARRYDLQAGTVYLFRPDQHVAARWRSLDAGAVETAVRRSLGVLIA